MTQKTADLIAGIILGAPGTIVVLYALWQWVMS